MSKIVLVNNLKGVNTMIFSFSRLVKLLSILLLSNIFTAVFANNISNIDNTTAPINRSNANHSVQVPILVYHNFNPTVPGSMNLTPERFKEQMQWIKDHNFTVMAESLRYVRLAKQKYFDHFVYVRQLLWQHLV